MKAMIVILTNLMTAITGMLMSMPPSEREAVAGLENYGVTRAFRGRDGWRRLPI